MTSANGTNASSKEPEFIFTNPGTYTVKLSISTPSCGSVVSALQTVIVNAAPTAMLSPDITLCKLGIYDFNNTTSSPTKTTFNGTTRALPDTYTWTVIPSGTGTFEFVNGTTENSKYPSVKFNNYEAYTISVTHKNNCGTVTKTQKLTFYTAPVVNAGVDQSICFNDVSFPLSGVVTGTTSTLSWIGGSGVFSPSRNNLNAKYTPTAAEKNAGTITLRLRVTTALAPSCNQIDDDIILTIRPNISITSATSKSICTGVNVAYTPTTAVAGTTFVWVANGSANASGFSTAGNGNINNVITNTDLNANATVTYTITPQRDGCDGTPFIFVVTITPNPMVVASAPNLTICNRTSTTINLSSNLNNLSYTYTSSITGAITGNSNRTIGSIGATINDVLTNSGQQLEQ